MAKTTVTIRDLERDWGVSSVLLRVGHGTQQDENTRIPETAADKPPPLQSDLRCTTSFGIK